MPEVSDVVKALAGVDQLISVARAGLWGAAQATAPKDRWQNADDHLAAAIRAIENARALLAAVDKQEAYCTTCGVPLLNQMAGWKHWNGSGSYDAGHPADMDWRPADRAPDCGRCGDRGRFRENNTEAHCTCKRGRRMSELWYADKHGYAHPDEPDPEPPYDDDGAPF